MKAVETVDSETINAFAKAFIAGTYHGLDSLHLQRYFDEFCFRPNRRRVLSDTFAKLLFSCLHCGVIRNHKLFFLPPATPELNPIEQIWKEIRKLGFRNEMLKTFDKVIDRLCYTICSLSHSSIISITGCS